MLKGITEENLNGLMDFVGKDGVSYERITPFPNYRGRWICHVCTASIDDTNELPTGRNTIPHFSGCVCVWVQEQRENAQKA